MNIQEAIKTNKFVTLPEWKNNNTAFCHFLAKTGPYKDLVDCDYFVFYEDGFLSFSTSGPDLYANQLCSNEFEILPITEQEIDQALLKTKNLDNN